jgi:hypothetical protein
MSQFGLSEEEFAFEYTLRERAAREFGRIEMGETDLRSFSCRLALEVRGGGQVVSRHFVMRARTANLTWFVEQRLPGRRWPHLRKWRATFFVFEALCPEAEGCP